ncbi:hypothetical protein BTN45_26795 (plasmid) [Rhizobium sp. ZX09]|nr:hypothetical protein BTN45_26795 [Rhizobium sp. ZX09]
MQIVAFDGARCLKNIILVVCAPVEVGVLVGDGAGEPVEADPFRRSGVSSATVMVMAFNSLAWKASISASGSAPEGRGVVDLAAGSGGADLARERAAPPPMPPL